MEKKASLLILYKYLKKTKKLGTFNFYVHNFGRSNKNPTKNEKILETFTQKIEETRITQSDLRRAYFKAILGAMGSGRTTLKEDYLYLLYKDWIAYVDDNWPSMDEEYLKLKDKLSHERENIQTVEGWR